MTVRGGHSCPPTLTLILKEMDYDFVEEMTL
jgi:hypothetical protein